ncbi:MAG TPA: ComF family protein [Candidatus Pacebacteria bacterium]|nr:ComF family protein [Candidatus Paceibacterota bacterium]
MKNRAERLKNQKNVFKLKNPEKIKNQNIILFDDVYTTGATINEARKVLKKAGAKNIKVIVLTH